MHLCLISILISDQELSAKLTVQYNLFIDSSSPLWNVDFSFLSIPFFSYLHSLTVHCRNWEPFYIQIWKSKWKNTDIIWHSCMDLQFRFFIYIHAVLVLQWHYINLCMEQSKSIIHKSYIIFSQVVNWSFLVSRSFSPQSRLTRVMYIICNVRHSCLHTCTDH